MISEPANAKERLMSESKYSQYDAVAAFHGHWCPGLAIGIQASRIALDRIGAHSKDEEIVAVVETDMCGVDAIQFMTGCTFGKGNLIHLDYGKMAFRFFRRADGKGIRLVYKPKVQEAMGSAGDRDEIMRMILDANPEDLFDIQPLNEAPPAKAFRMQSFTCEQCGEKAMESRTRRFNGRILCIPCFEKAEFRVK